MNIKITAEIQEILDKKRKKSDDRGEIPPWPTSKAESDFVRREKTSRRQQYGRDPAHLTIFKVLQKDFANCWSRQVSWGYTIFDFWSPVLGVGIVFSYDQDLAELLECRYAITLLDATSKTLLQDIQDTGLWNTRKRKV